MKTQKIGSVEAVTSVGQPVTLDPDADLIIGTDLTKAMSTQAGLFAFYGILAVEAEARAKKAKYRIHCKAEDLDRVFRKKAAGDKTKITEVALKAKINRHSEMRALYEKSLELKRSFGKLNILKEAFKQRAEMLRSIGANNRAEQQQGELATMKSQARRAMSNAEE